MMTSRTARTAAVLGFEGECFHLLYDLRWLILFSMVLIAADFWFGLRDSISKKGGKFDRSTAIRKTLNKFVDHICYLLVGGILGKAIGEPYGIDATMVATTVVLIGCAAELFSIGGHILSLAGMSVRISTKQFLVALIRGKSKELGDAIDESVTIKDNSNESK